MIVKVRLLTISVFNEMVKSGFEQSVPTSRDKRPDNTKKCHLALSIDIIPYFRVKNQGFFAVFAFKQALKHFLSLRKGRFKHFKNPLNKRVFKKCFLERLILSFMITKYDG